MAINFNAQQYEKEFKPARTGNWEIPKAYKGKNPKTLSGFTQFVANDKGYLLPGVPRSQENPWGTFVGTWDMPSKIPGNFVDVPTARDPQALAKLMSERNDYQSAIRQKAQSPLSVVTSRSLEAAAKASTSGAYACPCGKSECDCAAKTFACPCGKSGCDCAAKSSSACACAASRGSKGPSPRVCSRPEGSSPAGCPAGGCPPGCCTERSQDGGASECQ